MTLHLEINKSARFLRICVILGCLTFAVPLIGYMINGSAMRFSGDDYCYASVLQKSGFWKAQWLSYTQPQAYNGNRYALTLFSGISGLFGPVMNGVLPTLVIVVWLIGMIYATRNIAHITRISIYLLEIFLLAEAIIFFTLYTAPSIAQILYWRSGMLPYLAPLAANMYLIGVILNITQKQKFKLWKLVGIGLPALLAGGFSEAAAVFQTGLLAFMLIGAFFIVDISVEIKRDLIYIISVALGFSLVACLLLAFSPANLAYLSKITRPDLFSAALISLHSGVSFVIGSLTSFPLPNSILLIFSWAVFMLIHVRNEWPYSFSLTRWMRNVVLVID
jgi:hypothetical protein